jgi:hypothetical protein
VREHREIVDDLFGVGREPDDPTVVEKEEGLMWRQGRTHRPGYERLSRSRFIGRQPMCGDCHEQILSASAAISKCLIVKTITGELHSVSEFAPTVIKLIRVTY